VDFVVRPPEGTDQSAWRNLWNQYLVFYETEVDGTVTDALWQRLMDPAHPIQGRVAEVADEVVGIVHYFAHSDTWDPRSRCYLQDLFVDPAVRGRGVGRGLIEAVVEHARREEWSGVYWHTAEDNDVARRLYDMVTGGASGFIVYEIGLDEA
jgi:GNAT superfamily N-acetyltransferase